MTGKVGTEKIFENDKVIVWNFELEPCEVTELHTHEHDYMWYAVAGTTLQVWDKDDNDLGQLEVPTGAVFSLKLVGDELELLSEPGKGMRVPACHKAENAGPSTYREVLVEYK